VYEPTWLGLHDGQRALFDHVEFPTAACCVTRRYRGPRAFDAQWRPDRRVLSNRSCPRNRGKTSSRLTGGTLASLLPLERRGAAAFLAMAIGAIVA
jgi:hypothetical protein